MKRFQLFSLASAMLLASAAGFTSCSSDSEDPLDGGSGVAGQVVKTQFVINIPYAGNESGGNARVSTRMTADNTQNNNNFLGLKDIEMFAYNEVPSETNPTSTRTIRIGTRNASNSDNYRRIYSDIAIPVGTQNMILYARATRTKTVASGPTNKTNFEAGSLTNPYGNFKDDAKPNLSELNFNLEAIHKNNDFNDKGQAILTKLKDIANTTVDGTSWSEIGNDQTADNDAKILKSLYTKFISLTAGSANSVNSFIKHLKDAIESQGVNTAMAKEIIKKCTPVSSIFPRDCYLPDGVAKVKFNPTTSSFAFETVTAGTTTQGSNLIDYKTVTYPSELAYFVSSPLKTSTTNPELTNLPSYDNWLAGTDGIWKEYGDIVQNNTLFVALQKPVQYGVACLKSSIKCSTLLEDNAKEKIGSESNNTITVDDKSFPITGILIGGQPAGVKWDFEPASTTKPADFKYTIYDKDMNDGNTFTAKAEDTGTLPYNYTLVLDNKDTSSEGATQSNVNVVIELENNAADFYGADGLIPKGSKFYLAGTLNLNATNGVSKPNDSKVDHVFVKDHTTVANFTIKDLKKAYNCIPDLRTSKINVGLAVDLKWESGITFNVDL